MGVVRILSAINVKFSEETKTAYLLEVGGGRHEFPYTFTCRAGSTVPVLMFFNMETNRALVIVYRPQLGASSCYILNFWVANDAPILSANVLLEQSGYMTSVHGDFKDKYASYILDKTINS